MADKISAIVAGAQTALGLGMAIGGAIQKSKALKEIEQERADLEKVKYGEFSQDYFNMLQRRSLQGMPAEQKQYAEDQADRMMAASMYGQDRSGLGLAGLASAQMTAGEAYRKIASQDAELRMQNINAMQSEMQRRAEMAYKEKMDLEMADFALANRRREEAVSMIQSGLQTGLSGGSNLALSKMGKDEGTIDYNKGGN
jgi:hypothetical protein